MKLKKFQSEQEEWQAANHADSDGGDMLLGVGEETGELMHAHLKGKQGIRHSTEKIERLKKDAIGDIVIYLAAYCNLEGFDLEECIEDAWSHVSQRDWLKNKKDGS
jgi:NTP pyrophosphatase (non-canonical NTP hydrolase)